MLFTTKELIALLRSAVNVSNEESGVSDPDFLSMTDEDLTMFLKLGMSKTFPQCDSLENMPNGADYPVILSSKKELYLKLAVTNAPLYDLSADNNNQLKRSQRFSHYMTLANNAQEEYQDWIDNGGSLIDPNTGIQGVTSYTVTRSKDHYSLRNYENGLTPIVRVQINEVTTDSVAFSWTSVNEYFGKYVVYISESPIVDMFKDGSKFENKIDSRAKLILTTHDYRNNKKRIKGLQPETDYFIAVISVERNTLFGYKEIHFTTPSPSDDEDFSVDTLSGGVLNE